MLVTSIKIEDEFMNKKHDLVEEHFVGATK
ncbi:hypothetical protein I3843_05G178100 [Carya illinoinensis]|nr:hypothetical protein I3843_05G178100 [Carya illinoinensis]